MLVAEKKYLSDSFRQWLHDRIESRRERIQDMYDMGDLTRDKYRARLARLDAEAAAQQARLQGAGEAEEAPIALLRGLRDAWVRLADQPASRGRLLATVIQHVIVSRRADGGLDAEAIFRPYDLAGWPESIAVQIESYEAEGNLRKSEAMKGRPRPRRVPAT